MSQQKPQQQQQHAPAQQQQNHEDQEKLDQLEKERILSEEEMRKQELEDDADLRALKEKLQKLEARKPPKDKDELIDHLMERIEQAEQAVIAAEEVITHERTNRKLISAELKQKNAELKKLVEKEKRTLQEKVHDELEITLQQALREKMAAEKALLEAKKIMTERNMMAEEVDAMFLDLRDTNKMNEKLNQDQQKIIENLEEELQSTKNERDYLQNLSDERQKTIEKLNTDLDEAHSVIVKLEEARIILNKLMGPNGVITEREREKYLKNVQSQEVANYDANQSGAYGTKQINNSGVPPKGITGQSTKMLTQNNQYFYDNKAAAQQQPKNFNQYGGNAGLMDDANEDDFWYQNPGGQNNDVGGGAGQGQFNLGNSRTGSRSKRNGSIVQGNRY